MHPIDERWLPRSPPAPLVPLLATPARPKRQSSTVQIPPTPPKDAVLHTARAEPLPKVPMLQAAAMQPQGLTIPVDLPTGPLPRLQSQAQQQQLDHLSERLAELQGWLSGDLLHVEEALKSVRGESLAQRAGQHILAAGGKRLRPLCTLIAARIGPLQDPQARQHARDLAVAVELVHAATLLHDDVVDVSDTRRGLPTARLLHGNEVSIYAGDWLLVEALRRIVGTGHPRLLVSALDTIERLIFGEVQQSQRARQLAGDVAGYFEVVEGKTAALFRWALEAGAKAGGCADAETAALVEYGGHLGVAFQVIDDVLDLGGDSQRTGKALFTDLAEGKITLPLALMLQREPHRHQQVAQLAGRCADPAQRGLAEVKAECQDIVDAVRSCGALAAARAEAETRTELARAALAKLPQGAEVAALEQIGHALLARQS